VGEAIIRQRDRVRLRECVAVEFHTSDTVTDMARVLDCDLIAGDIALPAAPLICELEAGPGFRNARIDAQMIAAQLELWHFLETTSITLGFGPGRSSSKAVSPS